MIVDSNIRSQLENVIMAMERGGQGGTVVAVESLRQIVGMLGGNAAIIDHSSPNYAMIYTLALIAARAT